MDETEILTAARQLPPDERNAFLQEACTSDENRRHIDNLIAEAEQADAFFGETEGSPPATARGLLGNSFPAEEEGDQIGPYTLRKIIGEGGFGTVWLAEQTGTLNRTVALKIVKAGMDTGEVLKRFDAERQALAVMDHPNIAKVLEAGATATGRPYFVMERVEGEALNTYCDGKNQTVRQRLELFRDVCAAVNHAHQKGIIHRDLKPSNVMVSEKSGKPVVKVIDFGIAKATESNPLENTLYTRHHQWIGTPVYMSPEQAVLGGSDIDTRSDIYSLGVLLYELLSGHTPFDPKSILSAGYDEMRRIIREDDPPTMSTQVSTTRGERSVRLTATHGAKPEKLGRLLKGELEWIVTKALQKDRGQRYQSANAFDQDIERYLASEPVQAAAPNRLYKLRKFAVRHRVALATATLIAVVLVTATAASTVMAVWATRAEEVALENGEATRRALANAQIAVAGAAFRDADRGEMIRALESVPEDLRDQGWDYYSSKLGGSLGTLDAGDLGDVTAVVAVPGAPTRFAVAGRSGTVVMVDVGTGERVFECHGPANGKNVVPAFSPDGSLMAVTARNAPEIELFRVADGNRVGSLPAPSQGILQMGFAPDGRVLATRGGNGPRDQVSLVDIETGSVRWQKLAPTNAMEFSLDGSRLFTISGNDGFKIWDTATGDVLHRDSHRGFSLEIDPSGGRLAGGLKEGGTVVLDSTTGSVLARHQLDFRATTGIAWTAQGHLLTSGFHSGIRNKAPRRGVFRLWDTERGMPRGTFFGATGQGDVGGWAFQPESGYLLTKTSPPELWHLPIDLEAFHVPQSGLGMAACFLDHNRLLTRKGNGLTRYDLSDLSGPQEIPTPMRRGEGACAVHWPTGRVATATRGVKAPHFLRLYSTAGGKWVAEREIRIPLETRWLDFDAAGQRVLTVSRRARVYAVANDEQVLTLPGEIPRAVFAGTGQNIVGLRPQAHEAGEPGDIVSVFEGSTGEILRSYEAHVRLSELVVSPDRSLVALAGADAMVHILDADSLQERFRFRAHDGDITALGFHPTEAVIATASVDGSVKLWDYQTARLRRAFFGIDGRPLLVTFNPDGKLLALKVEDTPLRIYDLSAPLPSPLATD